MKSALAVTHEVESVAIAAAEISAQINASLPPVKNKCGILFAEAGYDWDAFLPAISKETGMDIVGCTSTAQISTQGYHHLSATLLALGGDDCVFASAVTPALNEDNADEIKKAFAEAKNKLGDADFKVVFAFSSSTVGCSADDRLSVLNDLAGGKPVFGGIAGDYFEFEKTRIFYNNEAREGALVILLVGGNVKPKFLVRNIPRKHLAKSKVTASHGHTVDSIDGISAYEFMRRNDVDTDSTMSLFYSPLTLEMENEEDYDGEPVCRPFVALDPKDGSGTTIATVPVGSSVAVQVIQNSDIAATTRDVMESMVSEIKRDNDESYEYSTILGVTCAGRHVVLSYDYTREGEIAKEVIPQNINFAGFYSFGEYCPTSFNHGKAKNRLHNLSFGLCAL